MDIDPITPYIALPVIYIRFSPLFFLFILFKIYRIFVFYLIDFYRSVYFETFCFLARLSH